MGFADKFNSAASAMAAAEPVNVQDAPVIPGRLVHIDGDALAYKASGPAGTDAGTSRIIAANLIEKARRKVQAERAIVHLTADNSVKAERYLIATVKPYQAKRVAGRKPDNWAYLREFLCNYSGTDFQKKVWASREADDGIAACAAYAVTQGRLDGIHADDKDMRMLPGIHLSWRDDSIITTVPAGVYDIYGKDDKLYGQKWFWLQMLHGDTADNIPGLEQTWLATVQGMEPRMAKAGEVTAEKILSGIDNEKDASEQVLAHYRRGYRGQGEAFAYDRFLEQALLLWLRQDRDATLMNFLDRHPWLRTTRIEAAANRLTQRVEASKVALKELEA